MGWKGIFVYTDSWNDASHMFTPTSHPRRFWSVALLVLGGGFGLLLWTTPEPPPMTVLRSRGGSARGGGGVLVPGDVLRSGDGVRVLTAPLYLERGEGSMRFRLVPGSRMRIQGISSGRPELRLRHDSGRGTAVVRQGRVSHRWKGLRFMQTAGSLRWSLGSDGMVLIVGTTAEGVWWVDGDTAPLRTPPASLRTAVAVRQGTPSNLRDVSPETPLFYHKIGSLVPPEDLVSEVSRTLREQGPPSSLIDVFGHWPRDRWGQVYLLDSRGSRTRLRSAGADGVLETADDRRWVASAGGGS